VESAWYQCLKLKCDEPLSNFVFNLDLRRYTSVGQYHAALFDAMAVPEEERVPLARVDRQLGQVHLGKAVHCFPPHLNLTVRT